MTLSKAQVENVSPALHGPNNRPVQAGNTCTVLR